MIRSASEVDQGSLAALKQAAADDLGSRRGGPELLVDLRWSPEVAAVDDTQMASEDPTRAAWLAQWHEVDIGVCEAEVSPSQGRGRVGLVKTLWVQPEARGIGAGGSLLSVAMQWMVDQGADTVEAVALPGDRHTKSVLEAAGYRARMLVMSARVNPDPSPHSNPDLGVPRRA